MPVEVLGLSGTPGAGDEFSVAGDEKTARDLAEFRKSKSQETRITAQQAAKLENMFANLGEGDKRVLKVVLKADVRRSLEAITQALADLGNDEVSVNVLGAGVGGITETDANMAVTYGAAIFGFNVRADASAKTIIEREGIDLRYYSIIYELLDDVKKVLSAHVNGIPLGFANVVPRERVGLVAASGTGLQQVAVFLAARGEGISQAVGVGGRDMSEAVGGLMTLAAIEALGADARTELIVVIGKPPARRVRERVEGMLADIGKPAVVALLGAGVETRETGRIRIVGDLEAAAEALKALKLGLHVMLFSDIVPVAAQRAIKTYARDHDLIVMGPDFLPVTRETSQARARSRFSWA